MILLFAAVGIILIVVAVVFTSGVLSASPAEETYSGEVQRELPDTATPGEAVTVRLHFDLPESADVTVEETIQFEGETVMETRSVPAAEDNTIFYQVSVPENAQGSITFSGTATVPETSFPVTGDDTVQVSAQP